jgi:hypothetical protein
MHHIPPQARRVAALETYQYRFAARDRSARMGVASVSVLGGAPVQATSKPDRGRGRPGTGQSRRLASDLPCLCQWMSGRPVVQLTRTGARSGMSRTTPVLGITM